MNADGIPGPLWDHGSGEPPWDLTLGEQIWDLHQAFVEAARSEPSFYPVTAETVEFIRSLAENREEEMALEVILSSSSATLPPPLFAQVHRVARLILAQYPGETAQSVDDFVMAWLEWRPDSGVEPPYQT